MNCSDAAELHLRLALEDNRNLLTGGLEIARWSDVSVSGGKSLSKQSLKVDIETVMHSDGGAIEIVLVDEPPVVSSSDLR